VDWEAVRAELRPRVAEVESNRELRDILREMLGRLGQSHFNLIPKEMADSLDEPERAGTPEAAEAAEADESRKSRGSDDSTDSEGSNAGGSGPASDADADADDESVGEGEGGRSDEATETAAGDGDGDGDGEAGSERESSARASESPANRPDRLGEREADAESGKPRTGLSLRRQPVEISTPGMAAGDSDPQARSGDFGFEVRLIDGAIVVFRVEPSGPAYEAGVQPGWVVKSVGRTDLDEFIAPMLESGHESVLHVSIWQSATSLFRGPVDSTERLVFLDGENAEAEIELNRKARGGERIKFGNLPPVRTTFDAYRVESDALDVRVGVAGFNMWLFPILEPFAEAMEAFENEDGIIIDLRGNVGGIGALVMRLSGYFVDRKISLGELVLRGQTLSFNTMPQRISFSGRRVTPFAGPLVILIDSTSASTSEVFAAGLQAVGRARIIGTTSAGAALPANMTRLPNGDVMVHAIGDSIPPAGESVEGRGVVPDEIVPAKRADLLAGRDAALEAAVRWIAENRDFEWEYDEPDEE